MYETLLAKAEAMGLEVSERENLPDNRRGLYLENLKRILIKRSATPMQKAAILAHELGHAHHGHNCTNPRNEAQAWRWAALELIDPAEYAQAEYLNPNPNYIAIYLDVTVEMVQQYQQHLQSTGKHYAELMDYRYLD